MEVQLFILGHVILLGICVCTVLQIVSSDSNDMSSEEIIIDVVGGPLLIFIPLEIIYWGLHWWFVP